MFLLAQHLLPVLSPDVFAFHFITSGGPLTSGHTSEFGGFIYRGTKTEVTLKDETSSGMTPVSFFSVRPSTELLV